MRWADKGLFLVLAPAAIPDQRGAGQRVYFKDAAVFRGVLFVTAQAEYFESQMRLFT